METKYDFSGYVTKNDILCSDGRTIRQNAFLENDGKIVPMVWMHRHDSPDNVLGHMLLENRPDGVYGYGFFNETPKAQTAKALVQHGDISCMSIFANQLKQRAGDVIHGLIQEVSLVLSGANRGALIDSRLAHGEFSDEEAVICMGDTVDPIEVNEEGNTLAHYGRKGMKWGQNIFQTEIEGSGKEINENAEAPATAKPLVIQTRNSKNLSSFPDTIRKKAEGYFGEFDKYAEALTQLHPMVSGMEKEEARKLYQSEKIQNMIAAFKEADRKAYDILIPASEKSEAAAENKWTEDDYKQDMDYIDDLVEYVFGSDIVNGDDANKPKEAVVVSENLKENTEKFKSHDSDSAKDTKTSVGVRKDDEKKKRNATGSVSQLAHNDSDEGATMEHAEKDRTVEDVLNEMTDEQRGVVFYLLANARKEDTNMKHSEEDETVKNNVFEQSEEQTATLSHADITAIFDEAKRNHGSLKDTFLAHSAEYGIENIEYLFPDDRQLTSSPIFIKKPDEWVKNVMANISHTPFARVRSVFADITEADARAKGYVKGNRKTEEVITLLKRKTDPTTIYKKQKLDRDDQVDITDLNIASWLKTEMRMKLDEEIAQGILIGDLRNPASDDKIDEQKLRPIWKDDDLFVIRKALPLSANMTPDDRARKFIRMAVKARKDYRGKGNPTLYTTEDLLTDMLMIEDTTGRPLYDSEAKLCTALRVKEIVAVPSMENVSRIVGTSTMNLMGIIVNLADYNVGADKGGSIEMFEDFDIDFNQNKYLIETRISGALTAPYSAIVIEGSESMYLDTDPEDPTTTLFGKNVSDLQSNLIINEDSIAGTLKYVTGYTGYSGDPELQKGNFLALKFSAPDSATTTVELLGGHSAPVTLDSDMNAVFRIENRNQKVKVVSAVDGMEIAKVYSLRLLKLNGPNA